MTVAARSATLVGFSSPSEYNRLTPLCHSFHSGTILAQSSSSSSSENATSGKFRGHSMNYQNSVAYLLSNKLGIPTFMATDEVLGKTPSQVAQKFNLSVRGASALLVTLCRMDVVQILEDSDESVDDIVYKITPSAKKFLADQSAATFFSLGDVMCAQFTTPEALLEGSRPMEKKDRMSEMLEGDDDEMADSARRFTASMNSLSYCCAKALPEALGLASADNKPMTFLDIAGGSAINTIEVVRSNPNIKGIVYELPYIKPITMEYIDSAGLLDRISVVAGNFFTDDAFPGPVDCILLSNVFHDWSDEVNLDLISKAYDCLIPGGKIVVSELLLSDDVKSSTPSATSMNIRMLTHAKGRQYRPKELFLRLKRAGFIDPHVKSLVDDYDLIVATKP